VELQSEVIVFVALPISPTESIDRHEISIVELPVTRTATTVVGTECYIEIVCFVDTVHSMEKLIESFLGSDCRVSASCIDWFS